jgi:hypothetical protein
MKRVTFVALAPAIWALTLFAQQPAPQTEAQPHEGGWRKISQAQDSVQQPGASSPSQAADPSFTPFASAPASTPASNQAPVGPPSQLTIPAGTWISVRVNEVLSSDQNRAGDGFTATLTQPLVVQGYVVARAGQTIGGQVADAQKAGRIKGTSRLALELTELSLVDGQQVPMRTQLFQFDGGTTHGRDATAIASTTGIGAAIGAAADGGFGAGMGAIAGAGASIIGVLATRGRPTVIYPEDALTFRTVSAVNISTDGAPQAFQAVTQRDYAPQLQTRPAPSLRQPAPYPYFAGSPYYGAPYYGYPYWGPGPYFGYGYGPGVFIYSRPYYRFHRHH